MADHTKNDLISDLVIVGGGMAGTTTLLHTILRAIDDPALDGTHPLRIRLLERYPLQINGGIAYGQTPHFSYNLNLTGWRITPFAHDKIPAGFPTFNEYIDAFAAETPGFKSQYANPSRQMYGLYLGHLIDIAVAKAGAKVDYQTVYGEATDLKETKTGASVTLADGSHMNTGHVVLATGLKEAVAPAFAFNVAADPNYLDYPYSEKANGFYKKLLEGAKNTEQDSALVIGTGLSAIDSAIRLLDGGYKGKITMVSRRGLMHAVYRDDNDDPRDPLKGEPRSQDDMTITKTEPRFVKALQTENDFDSVFNVIETELKSRVKQGYTTEEVLGYWETFVPDLYAKFPEETANMLLKYETAINVMRVGTTPALADKILDAVKRGQVEIIAAHVQDIHPKDGQCAVTLRRNDINGQGIAAPETRLYSTVISGIGNSTKYDLPPEKIGDALWRNLRARNAYEVHALRDGVKVTNDFALVSGDGKPYQHVSVVGVPISGHMNVTAYPYPEKQGSGARLGAFTLNIQGILGGVMALVDSNYQKFAGHLPQLQQRNIKSTPATLQN